MRQIYEKHSIDGDRIIKTATGEVVPDSEPVILFRGRDRMDRMIVRFQKYADENPTK